MIVMTVVVDVRGLKNFEEVTKRDLRGAGNGPIRRAMRRWGVRYRGFAQERFDVFSKGGGDWPDLAESTKAGRRHGHGPGSGFSILRDTNTLFSALDPIFVGNPGQYQQDVPYGIRVGYGGPGKHPDGQATIWDIARFHDTGGGRLPQRKLIVPPDAKTLEQMRVDMQRGMAELARYRRAP